MAKSTLGQGHRQLLKSGGLASRIEFVACNKGRIPIIWALLSFDSGICNTAYNLKAFFSFFNFLLR